MLQSDKNSHRLERNITHKYQSLLSPIPDIINLSYEAKEYMPVENHLIGPNTDRLYQQQISTFLPQKVEVSDGGFYE